MKDITEKINRFLNESNWKAGQWIVQHRTNENEYGLLISQLKNGAWTVISKSDERVGGKARKISTKGWYPPPEIIDASKVPPKIKEKIQQKMKELKIEV